MRPNILYVDSSRDDFNVIEGELGALSNDTSIDRNQGTAIIIESISVASLLVCIQVDSSQLVSTLKLWDIRRRDEGRHLQSRFFEKFDTGIELAQLVMTTTRIREYFHPVQAH